MITLFLFALDFCLADNWEQKILKMTEKFNINNPLKSWSKAKVFWFLSSL